jgi:AcrR family transcriptional regulator
VTTSSAHVQGRDWRGQAACRTIDPELFYRARIVEQAAELIYVNGVHGTNNELLRKAAGISGSQLNHYFPDKESLVLAVITWRAEQILNLHTSEHFAGFD